MILTDEMHDAVVNSPVGQFIDRLIREEVARGGVTSYGGRGSVIQDLWRTFMEASPKPEPITKLQPQQHLHARF